MAVWQSAVASFGLPAPLRRFTQYEAALRAIAEHEAALCEDASRTRSLGLPVTDQDQPEEAFGLFPAHPVQPPLAIVGGMGPLAGLMAFRRACLRFQNSRVVVLYQACSTPDRSTVILGGGAPEAGACREMARRLAGAVDEAVGLADEAEGQVRCLIACNSAHYFWRPLQEALRADVRMVSLVEASVEALRLRPRQKVLVLTTEGARAGEVFSLPFRAAGIAFEEPSQALGGLLMRAIFEGIKSLDTQRAVELGNEFFETVLATGQDYDCILAGCTEIPLTIDLLRQRGSPAVSAFLRGVKIVDPLEEALCRA